ncbi:MAG: DUF5683 domain-containing protein [Fibrobacter sp.]|nr:DUF5683 domain-containing protein [Fibrobacter sp.]
MRKISLLSFFVLAICAQGAFAQVRDLFAEFESEAAQDTAAAVSSETVASSAAVVPESSAAEVSSSSAAVESSSAVVESSSAAAPVDTAKVDTTAVTAPIDTSAVPADTTSSANPVQSDSVAAPVDSSAAPVDSAAVDSAKVDSATVAPVDSAVVSSSSEPVSSSSSEPASSSSSVQVAEPVVIPSSSSMSRRDLLGPVKVSKVNGIDEMKGRYKSPKKAMFMSLVVPGSGQLYTGGSSFTYVRGAVYLALEAALWGGWYYFSVYKYDNQVKNYKKFAKKHYSIGRYEKEMLDLVNQLASESEESYFETRYMSSRESFCEAIYGKASASGCYTAGKMFDNDAAHAARFRNNPVSLGEEVKAVGSFYDGSALYSEISDKSYVLGWDDVEDAELAMNLHLDDDYDGEYIPLAKSKNMKEYRDMRSKATDYANMQAWFFGGLIVNHLVSAVDAAFTANAHNKELYSEDLSWYDHLHFDSYLNVVDGFDVGVQASWGF